MLDGQVYTDILVIMQTRGRLRFEGLMRPDLL